MYILGALFTILFAFPLFWMLESKSVALIITAVMIAMNFGHGMMFGPELAYFPELFGARVRYSGASFGFQVERPSAAALRRSLRRRWSDTSAEPRASPS